MTRSFSILPDKHVEIDVELEFKLLSRVRTCAHKISSHKMRVDTERFKRFYNSVKDQFPYNDVRVSRNRFDVKWVLMTCKTDPGILFHHGKLYPLLCSTVEADIVQHLIISKQALPLPHDFCLLMDCMFYWGRSLHGPWYNKTLELINFYLQTSDLKRTNFTATDLYCDVIQMRVQQIIGVHFHNN